MNALGLRTCSWSAVFFQELRDDVVRLLRASFGELREQHELLLRGLVHAVVHQHVLIVMGLLLHMLVFAQG